MQETNEVKTMSKEEIEELLVELSKHLAYAGKIIKKINTNRRLEIAVNLNWKAPQVLRAEIMAEDNGVRAGIHCANVIDNLGLAFKWEKRPSDVYPFEKISSVDGVGVYELLATKD